MTEIKKDNLEKVLSPREKAATILSKINIKKAQYNFFSERHKIFDKLITTRF